MSELFNSLVCQYPHGLVAHFYPSLRSKIPRLEKVSIPSRVGSSFLHLYPVLGEKYIYECQYPHGLVAHFYFDRVLTLSESKFSVSIPSRVGSSFLLRR